MGLRERIGVDISRRLKLEDAIEWAARNDVRFIDIQLDTARNALTTFDLRRCKAVRSQLDRRGIKLGLHTLSAVNVAEYSPPTEETDGEYPVVLTTGRIISQFLSGTQTRRIGPLLDMDPEPFIEIHPRLAAKLSIRDGAWVTAETRRGRLTLRARVVATIRPDTIFVPYHWPGRRSVNRLTIAAQDPISKIPEFKACAARLRVATDEEAREASV